MPTFGSAANALSAMFFFMLFTLGLDTSFCWAETLTASVEGFLPVDKRPKTWVISLLTCTTCFFIGLPFATTKGNVILDCVDYFVGTSRNNDDDNDCVFNIGICLIRMIRCFPPFSRCRYFSFMFLLTIQVIFSYCWFAFWNPLY